MITIKKSISHLLGSKKHKKYIFLAIIFCISLLSLMNFKASALNGSGSESDPILINNLEDLNEMKIFVDIDYEWSCGKYFSLQSDIDVLSSICIEDFFGTFDGNRHTLTLSNESVLFRDIWNSGVVKNLTLDGNGRFVSVNRGTIVDCTSNSNNKYGIVWMNSGDIQNCIANGKFHNGISEFNTGRITMCLIEGEIVGSAGIADINKFGGVISHCRVRSRISSLKAGGLLHSNGGTISDCTMNGIFLNANNSASLIFHNHVSTNIFGTVRRCVVSGNEGMPTSVNTVGEFDNCGYVSSGFTDSCNRE